MKNKLMKILGVALTLAVLVGLLLPAMPVSAGTMAWTSAGMVSTLSDSTSFDSIAFAPDGKTVFAWDCDEEVLVKSLDAGKSWLPPGKVGEGVNVTEDLEYDVDLAALAVSPRYATDGIVVAVSWQGDFFYSEDGGKTFEQNWEDFTNIDLGENAQISLDISYNWDDKLAIMVGSDEGIDMYIGKEWRQALDYGDVLAVAFAPDYDDSDTVMAVVEPDGVYAPSETDLMTARIDGDKKLQSFNDDPDNYTFAKKVEFKAPKGEDYNLAADWATKLVFPSDYDSDSNAIVFVGLTGYYYPNQLEEEELNTAGTLDAYRADLKSETGIATNLRLDKKVNAEDLADEDIYVESISYKGTSDSGTLAVGLCDAIFTSTNADTVDGAATWVKPKKLPTGDEFLVAFSSASDTLYVASSSPDEAFGSGWFASNGNDYSGFNGISRISVESTKAYDPEVEFSGGIEVKSWSGAGQATQYLLLNTGDGDNQILFKTTDTGASWQEISAVADTAEDMINSVASAGDTIYLIMNDNNYKKSTNGGWTFAPGDVRNDIEAFGLVDADNFFYATNGQDIYKNDARTPVTLDTTNDIIVLVTIPGFFVVKTMGEDGLSIFFSGDNGVTFKELKGLNPGSITFDVPGRTIYGNDGATLYSYNVDSDTDWAKVQTMSDADGNDLELII